MSRPAHIHALEFFRALKSRVRQLSPGPRKPRASDRSSLRPWILILSGLGIGLLGYTTVNREAREGWLLAHSPPRTLWERTLLERGYRVVTDEGALMKLRGELPSLYGGAPRVWILENRRAIYLASGQDVILFSLRSNHPPSFALPEWEALGFGWDAFEALLALDIPMPAPHSVSRRVDPRPPLRDSREIRF